jgi:hypothetical protein
MFGNVWLPFTASHCTLHLTFAFVWFLTEIRQAEESLAPLHYFHAVFAAKNLPHEHLPSDAKAMGEKIHSGSMQEPCTKS